MPKFGFSDEQWSEAKAETKALLAERSRLRGMIPYSDLVRALRSVNLDAHDPRLFELLGEVSTEEDDAGRGMLSVIVVHKVGDMQPGPGFFELAKSRGKDTSDILRCWIDELHVVHGYWSRQAASSGA